MVATTAAAASLSIAESNSVDDDFDGVGCCCRGSYYAGMSLQSHSRALRADFGQYCHALPKRQHSIAIKLHHDVTLDFEGDYARMC